MKFNNKITCDLIQNNFFSSLQRNKNFFKQNEKKKLKIISKLQISLNG